MIKLISQTIYTKFSTLFTIKCWKELCEYNQITANQFKIMPFCGCWTICRKKDKSEKLCDDFDDCDKVKGDNGTFAGSKEQSDLSFDILGKSEAEEILKGGDVETDAASITDCDGFDESGELL